MNNKQINIFIDTVKMITIIAIAILLISGIIFFVSEDPQNAIYYFFVGPFTSLRRFGNVLEGAIPLTFTALAVILIFRCGLFSMISEGSFFIGLMASMIIGVTIKTPFISPILGIAFASLLGALLALIPGILKLKWDVSEVVSSIMLNYVVQFFVIYMVNYHYREPLASSLASLKIYTSASLPLLIKGTKVHLGLIIAILISILVWFYLYKTKNGYKLRVVGDNKKFAKYVGISSASSILGAQFFAGAIAGAGGGIEMLGMYSRFKWTVSPGYGWTGIAVALLANSNPLLVPLSAFFISYLDVGASIMARNSDVSNEMVMMIQGILILLIASTALFSKWRQRLISINAEREMIIQKENSVC